MDYATEVVRTKDFVYDPTAETNIQEWIQNMESSRDKYRDLVYGIIDFIKKDVTHEGTHATFSPTEILDKIYGMAADLPDVKERAYGER